MEFFRVNPNGNAEDCTTSTHYEVCFSKYKKHYYLSISPCNHNNGMWSTDLMAHLDKVVTMCPVKRQNAKVLKMCEDWLERNIDYVDKAFVTGGMEAVREYFDKNWLAIGGK